MSELARSASRNLGLIPVAHAVTQPFSKIQDEKRGRKGPHRFANQLFQKYPTTRIHGKDVKKLRRWGAKKAKCEEGSDLRYNPWNTDPSQFSGFQNSPSRPTLGACAVIGSQSK